MRKFTIKAETTSPYFKNQNPSENRIGVVKPHTNSIMDQSGAPIKAWFLCMCYEVCILNHCATQTLNWRLLIEVCYVYTPNIFQLLQHEFFNPVYFLDVYQDKGKTKFPKSNESFEYWCGSCPDKGDAFIYWIILPDRKTTLARSILRSAKYDSNPNKRVNLTYEITSFPGRYEQDENEQDEK